MLRKLNNQTYLSIIVFGLCVFLFFMYLHNNRISMTDQGDALHYEQINIIDSISPTDFANRLETEQNRKLIDVRTKEEFSQGHIAGAVNIDYYDENFINELLLYDKHEPLAIYCRSGRRSGETLQVLEQAGFTNVVDLSGGILAWKNELNADVCKGEIC